jgi:signal transduction histidine kinase
MRITPGKDIPRDTLKPLEIFEGLDDAQLDWLREHGERMEAAPDDVIVRPGDPADYMYVLLTGSFQWTFGAGGQNTVVTESRSGAVGGMLPYSRAVRNNGSAVSIEESSALRIHKDRFHDMLHRIPALGQRLVSIMSDRVKRSTQFVDQREKMSALGKLAAGLAHELNNPASALKRTANELVDRMNRIQRIAPELMVRDVRKEDIEAAVKFRNHMIKREGAESLSAVARGEREDEVADWLEDHQVPEPWVMAEQLVSMGVTMKELDEFAAAVKADGATLPLALQWIEGSAVAHLLVREILSAADRISHLVQSIKVHSHLDRNPNKQEIDIRDGIESTLTILGHKLRKKSIVVKREFAENTPKVPAYPGELNQVWTNLIDNAIDAMDEGGTLTINTAKEGGCVCARICDTGHGIPPDIQKRIFEPFFTTKAMGEGTGLGLDIVQRIVTIQHGGDVEVKSQPGKTCFTVWFPLTPQSRSG